MIETPRLILRQWCEEDKPEFAKLCADPQVMKFFPNTLSAEQSTHMVNRLSQFIDDNGFGFWAVELKINSEFVGFVGLNKPENLPFSPCVEIGWRLAVKHWGKGLATEAAQSCLEFAFRELKLEEVVAFTPALNKPSKRVMERIGMQDTQLKFVHPAVAHDHYLAEHVLYKISVNEWQQCNNRDND